MKYAIGFYLFVHSSLIAAEPLMLGKDYWQNEAFLKSFNGSYRINARIEPFVTTEERGLLVSIQPLMADGKRKDALDKLTNSELIKSSAAIAFNAGNIQFELGDLEAAQERYLQALKIFPSFRRAHRNLGFVYVRQNDWEKALPALEESIRLGDHDAATFGQLAFGRIEAGHHASALQAFQLAQLTQPQSIDWKVGTAQCLQELKRHEEALSLLDEVIAARPDEPSYYLFQSSVYLSLGRSDDAIANLDLVRRLGKLDAGNHLLLANLHLRANSNQLARPMVMSALSMEEKAPYAAAINVLDFTTLTRDWSLARDFATAIEKAYPDAGDPTLKEKQKYLMALIDIESGDDAQGGAIALEEIIRQNPLSATSLILLASHRAKEQRYQEAIMLLEQATRVEGHEYKSLVELAKVQVATRSYPKALANLDKALKIEPNDDLRDYRDAIYHLSIAND